MHHSGGGSAPFTPVTVHHSGGQHAQFVAAYSINLSKYAIQDMLRIFMRTLFQIMHCHSLENFSL